MTSSPINPLVTPLAWRAFLYNEVLLPWETRTVQIRSDVYSKKALEDELGLIVLRKNNLSELRIVVAEYSNQADEFLIFYCDGKGYAALFKRLRDTVAHAHYTVRRRGWITMHHQFKGRGERKPTVRLMASMKFTTLKLLVQFMSPSHS
jgi:hypothetical protein